MNDPVDEGAVSEAATEQTEAAPATEPAAETVIPKARLDEVINDRNSLREQLAQYEQERYALALKLQKIEAEREAEKRFAGSSAPQPLSPEEAKQKAAKDQLQGLIKEAVQPVIQQHIQSLSSQFAPMQEIIEDTKRTKFWSDPNNAQLPEDLKIEAEKAYMTYRNQIPNLDRAVALQFAKGARYDRQMAEAKQKVESNRSAVNAVNRAASTTSTSPSASPRGPKPDSEKTAADLSDELRALAERGYQR